MLKTSTQHQDHNVIEKFSKTPSASNSGCPMGQRKHGWFCLFFFFPLKASLLGNFPDLFPSAWTNKPPSPWADFFFPPPLFLHYVPLKESNNWPGQRTCLLLWPFVCSGIFTAQQKKKRDVDYHAMCKRAACSDAEDQPQALWQIAAFAFTHINCFNVFLATSRPKIRLWTYQVLFFLVKD